MSNQNNKVRYVNFRVSEGLFEKLHKLADMNDFTVADYLRHIIKKEIDNTLK